MSDMLIVQKELWERHKDEWSPMEPQYARNHLLWMIEELGEAIAIIKKRGEAEIMSDAEVRAAFVEELVDVHMYFNEVLLRYGISAAEFSAAYLSKHEKNMKRDYKNERKYFIPPK